MPVKFALPRYVQLYPTTRCNQKCSFCFNSAIAEKADMSRDNALELLEILSSAGIRDVDIMGGEPFLLDWMPDFISKASHMGMALSISTNGSRPDAVKRLGEIELTNVNIGVSIEGSTAAIHNALTRAAHFDLAISTISNLFLLGLEPLVKTVVNGATMHDLQNIVGLARDLGVRKYCLIHMDVMTADPSLLREAPGYVRFRDIHEKVRLANPDMEILSVHASCFVMHKLPQGARCAGGVLKLSVMPDGSAYPCNLFHSLGALRLGNIFEDDLSSIWNNRALTFFRSFRENSCGGRGCVNREDCTGGCPAHGYCHSGDPDAPDVRCAAGPGCAA